MPRPGRRRATLDVRALFVLVAVIACSKERSDPVVEHVDQTRPKFVAAVDRFVAASRTPAAFRELAQTAGTLAVDMDKSTRDETERRVIVLALFPVKSVENLPIPAQVEALALTVWPTLLADPINVRSVRDPAPDVFAPLTGDTVERYLARLCDSPLAVECARHRKHRDSAIAALAYARATARAKAAVAACEECRSDPSWHEAVRAWEQVNWAAEGALDRDPEGPDDHR